MGTEAGMHTALCQVPSAGWERDRWGQWEDRSSQELTSPSVPSCSPSHRKSPKGPTCSYNLGLQIGSQL